MKRIPIPALPSGSARRAGTYDKAGRWYPSDEICVAGSFNVRSPSRSWPNSYRSHYYTLKFSRMLFAAKPRTWLRIQRMDPDSAEAAPFLALVAERRLGVES